jgi:hypothetical protein
MISWSEAVRVVETRAGSRCEYCRMHQSLQGATFHVEHIVPKSHGGASDPSNYAWCCPSCNLHKSDRTQVTDPADGKTVPLFNPRQDTWSDHFRCEGYRIIGLTPVGRAMEAALVLNHPRRLKVREAESLFGLFPP